MGERPEKGSKMSWWVYLSKDGRAVDVPQHQEGGTYQVGGCEGATLNITYNYSAHYRAAMGGDGLADLNGMIASEAIPILERAVQELGVVRNADYWAATAGNAGSALNVLLGWARLYPDATFVVH